MFKKVRFGSECLTALQATSAISHRSVLTILEVTYKGINGSVLPFIESYKYLQIFRNGLFLTEGEDYTLDPTKITFIIPLADTDLVKLVAWE